MSYSAFESLYTLLGLNKPWEIEEDKHFSFGRGSRVFANRMIQPSGIKILYNLVPFQDTGEIFYDVAIDIGGRHLSATDNYTIWQLAIALSEPQYSLKCSRFDIAIDDYHNLDLIADVQQATLQGNVTGFRKYRHYQEGNVGEPCDGETFYLGSRQSGRCVRVYNAKKKHDINAIRWEQENKREYAQNIFEFFCLVGREYRDPYQENWEKTDKEVAQILGQWLGSVAIGHINFVDRTNEKQNGETHDLPKLPFWQDLINRVGSQLKTTIYAPKPTMQKTIDWLHRQCSKGIAMLKILRGSKAFYSEINQLVSEGEKRITTYDQLLVLDYKNPGFIYSVPR